MGRLADTPTLPVGTLGRRRRKRLTGAGATWWDHAACAQPAWIPLLGLYAPARFDPNLWHPEQGQSDRADLARTICAACPVWTNCLGYALAANETLGIWGGTTERQRRQLKAWLTRRLGVQWVGKVA